MGQTPCTSLEPTCVCRLHPGRSPRNVTHLTCRFAHIQVKTFVPGNRTCSVGVKSERPYGENFFWVLGGIPTPESGSEFEYYIIPSKDMASNMTVCFRLWADTPGAKGQKRNAENNTVRAVQLPPRINPNGWDISQYRDRWDLIEQCVTHSK